MTIDPENPYAYTPVDILEPPKQDFHDGKLFILPLFVTVFAYVMLMFFLPSLLAQFDLSIFGQTIVGIVSLHGLVFGMGILYSYLRCKKANVTFLKFKFREVSYSQVLKNLFQCYGLLIISMILMKYIFELFNWPITQHPIGNIVKDLSLVELFCMGIGVVVVAPITEEIVFRRIIYSAASYITASAKYGLIIACCSFAIVHQIPVALLAYFFIAYTLQKAYNKNGNILDAIFLHMAFNFCQFSLMILLKLIGVPT